MSILVPSHNFSIPLLAVSIDAVLGQDHQGEHLPLHLLPLPLKFLWHLLGKDHPCHCLCDKISSLFKSLHVRKVGIGTMELNTCTFIYRLILKQSHYFEILVLLFTEISNSHALLTCAFGTKEVFCKLKHI